MNFYWLQYIPLLCCDVGLVSELHLTAGCVLMDFASPAVSRTTVYANGLNDAATCRYAMNFLAHLDSDLSISSIPFIAIYSSKVYGSSALHQAVAFSVHGDGNRIFSQMFLVKDWVDGQSPDKQP